LFGISCTPPVFKSVWSEEKAPKKFTATFETTHGNFEIEAMREWSPAGVDRLYQLIKRGFYTDIAIYRVVPGYVVQFGISNDQTKNNAWTSVEVPDEPTIEKNLLGTISFARGGPNTRGTQLFINIANNSPRLDTLSFREVSGFPVVAKVTSGMEHVLLFFDEYGNRPSIDQDSINKYGNRYLQQQYPELDYIQKAYLTPDWQ
jgi:cyclophilin family peptidyl-prolyl cis-trans isomerase